MTVKIKATKVGASTIQLTGPNGVTAAVKVQVVPKPVKATSVSLKLVTDKTGRSVLRVVTTPRNATWRPVTWSSADPRIATVDAAGRIAVHAPGKAKITAKYGATKTTITLSTT
ncbi:MAG: Ig-like domain-containing protein [Bifidobacteriaceae bacterium]|nr:Ig-like domain-containing protein [Bifidobacteriaceae bacterium]